MLPLKFDFLLPALQAHSRVEASGDHICVFSLAYSIVHFTLFCFKQSLLEYPRVLVHEVVLGVVLGVVAVLFVHQRSRLGSMAMLPSKIDFLLPALQAHSCVEASGDHIYLCFLFGLPMLVRSKQSLHEWSRVCSSNFLLNFEMCSS